MDPELIQAAKKRDSEHLRRLILSGEHPDQRDDMGETALTWAAYLGHTPIVKDLLAAGANVDLHGQCFEASPLQLAVTGGHRGIVALLAVHADLNACDDHGATALLWAFDRTGDKIPNRKIAAVVEVLLQNGANPDLQDMDGKTPLIAAALVGNLAAIQSLLAAGADPGIKNAQDETALDLARKANQLKAAALLGGG